MIVKVTKGEVGTLLSSSEPTILLVTASHCPYCAAMKYIISRMRRVRVWEVSAELYLQELSQHGIQIQAVPTLLCMSGGKERSRMVGLPEDGKVIYDWIEGCLRRGHDLISNSRGNEEAS